MKEEEKPPELAAIHERLRRFKLMNDLTSEPKVLDFEQFAKGFLHYYGYTPEARQEFFVSEEQLDLLEGKVDRLRSWIINNCSDFTKNKDYQDWLESGDRTPEELEKLYWYDEEGLGLTAEKERPLAAVGGGHKLEIIIIDPSINVRVFLNFNDEYKLNIHFDGSENVAYNSFEMPRPLSEMTQEEFKIADFYLDQQLARFVKVSS